MGTILASTIIDRARRTLLELNVGEASSTDVRWDRSLELLPMLNAAQRFVCRHKPSANTVNASLQLASGAKQALPVGGTHLADVQHNLGSDGATPGRVVSLMDRSTLSRIDPNWMTATGSAVEGYVYDQRDPKTFYVYPRPSGTWYVNIAYFAVPDEVVIGEAINVDDVFDDVLYDYIVARALFKNTRAGNAGKAQVHMTMAANGVGMQFQAEMLTDPLDAPAASVAADETGKA